MASFFETHDMSKPVVLVLQFCKQKKYMGILPELPKYSYNFFEIIHVYMRLTKMCVDML